MLRCRVHTLRKEAGASYCRRARASSVSASCWGDRAGSRRPAIAASRSTRPEARTSARSASLQHQHHVCTRQESHFLTLTDAMARARLVIGPLPNGCRIICSSSTDVLWVGRTGKV